MDDVRERVEKVLGEVIGEPFDAARPGDIFELYAIDSLRMIELIVALEREFKLQLAFDDLSSLTTVPAIIDTISHHGQAA